jgi:hypothetical protein
MAAINLLGLRLLESARYSARASDVSPSGIGGTLGWQRRRWADYLVQAVLTDSSLAQL